MKDKLKCRNCGKSAAKAAREGYLRHYPTYGISLCSECEKLGFILMGAGTSAETHTFEVKL